MLCILDNFLHYLDIYYFLASKGEFREIWLQSQSIILGGNVGWKSLKRFLSCRHGSYNR